MAEQAHTRCAHCDTTASVNVDRVDSECPSNRYCDACWETYDAMVGNVQHPTDPPSPKLRKRKTRKMNVHCYSSKTVRQAEARMKKTK